jgi:hypothetical protein
MKKVILAAMGTVLLLGSAYAQFDDVKKFLMLQQYPMAKQSLDGLANKPKANTKPEYFLAKATVLSHLMKTSKPPESTKMRDESVEAYRKYLELDPGNTGNLLGDNAYRDAPINYYVSYYQESIDLFNKEDFANSSSGFKNMVDWSDFLIKNKMLNYTVDTAAVYLAGASHQNAKKYEEAAGYYARLADAGVGGPDYLNVYKFLMSHNFERGNIDAFQKYRQLGKKLYPKEEFFDYDEMEFILGMEDEAEKMKRLEAKMAKDPNDFKLTQLYGNMLFDKLNQKDANTSTPEYAADEAKMMTALTKTATALPDDPSSNFLMGKHIWYKADRKRTEISDVNDEIRKFNDSQKPDKTGKLPPPPKELTTKRDNLRQEQGAYMDQAVPYLLKAEPIMAKTYTGNKQTKQNYKILVDDMIQYYGFKRQYAKTPADKAKFEAEEKKWDIVYSKIQ